VKRNKKAGLLQTKTYPSNVCEKYFSVFAMSVPDAAGKMPFTVREW